MRRAINIPQLQLRHLAVQHPRVERTGGLFIQVAGMILTAAHLFIILLYSMAPPVASRAGVNDVCGLSVLLSVLLYVLL